MLLNFTDSTKFTKIRKTILLNQPFKRLTGITKRREIYIVFLFWFSKSCFRRKFPKSAIIKRNYDNSGKSKFDVFLGFSLFLDFFRLYEDRVECYTRNMGRGAPM